MNTWGSRRPTAWLRHSLSPYTYILLQPALFRAGLFFAFMPKQHLFHAAAFGGWLDIGWVRGRAFIRPGEGFAPGCPRRAAAVSQRGATPSFLERKKGGRKTFTGTPRDPDRRPVCSHLWLPPLGRKNNGRYFFSWSGRCIPGTGSVDMGAFLQAAPARRTAFLYL